MAKKSSSTTGGAAFTDTKRVEELVQLMAENGLTEIELVEDKSRIVLRRGTVSGTSVAAGPHMPTQAMHAPAMQHTTAANTPAAPKEDSTLVPIKSPMVGTFYTAPNPESDAYVSIGTAVDEKSVVCIIEAMKVFNEIHSEVRGTVVKLMVANGQAVEYGQPLFMVKPE